MVLNLDKIKRSAVLSRKCLFRQTCSHYTKLKKTVISS